VQYHTKGEFQPVTTNVSTNVSTNETESEIFHPTTEEPLHETIEISKQVEEAYVPLVETNVEKEQKEKEKQFAAWDASRSVL
jgi:glycogenin glucosyltransferase